MSDVGRLFSASGICLGTIFQGQTFPIAGSNFEAFVQADGSLKLFKVYPTNIRIKAWLRALADIRNEVNKRKQDLVTLQADVAALMHRVERGEDDADQCMADMGHLLALKGQHNQHITELNDRRTMQVTYQQTHLSARLVEGVYKNLPWFPQPVFWCPNEDLMMEDDTVSVTDDMPAKGPAIFTVGGNGFSALSFVEQYDPIQDTWRAVASMPTKRSCPAVAVVMDAQLYAGGGYDGVEVFSLAVASMPTKRSCPAVAVVDGQLYAGGGCGNGTLSLVERYDPGRDNWLAVADMTTGRFRHAMAVVDGHLYAVGGCNKSTLSSVERYDSVEDAWHAVAPMSTPRYFCAVAVIGDQMYAVGGSNGKGCLSSVERYDPAQNTWHAVASMTTKRAYLAVAVVDGHLYAVGGLENYTRVVLSSAERYDPAQNTWHAVASMTTKRYSLAVAVVGSHLYAIGGHNGSHRLSSVERYDPHQDAWCAVEDTTTSRTNLAVAVVGSQLDP